MLVETHQGVAEASDGFSVHSREYEISSAAFVFDILCNKMYNKPLETMIQEYLANARDAHREANCRHLPVHVTLPNVYEPYLVIRDFGPGLTEERIDSVFTKLGASTKSMDDVMTGGFGLGAKIGWAYNDSFTVISIVDGIQSVYLAYRDEKGVGRMDTLSVDTTDEPNGVAIKIRIKDQHHDKIHNIVSIVTYFWKVPPVNVNDANAFLHVDEPVVGGLYYGRLFFANRGVFAIVDGIPYTIDPNNIPILSRLRLSNDKALCLFFDVGEIEVAVNREGLNYTPKTKQNVTHTVQGVMDANAEAAKEAANIYDVNERFAALRACYRRLGAPTKTLTRLQPMVFAQFSYDNPDGMLLLVSCVGCRTTLVSVYNNGKVRDIVSSNSMQSTGNVTLESLDGTLQGVNLNGASVKLELSATGTLRNPDSIKYVCMIEGTVSETITKYNAKFRTLVSSTYSSRHAVIMTENKAIYDMLIGKYGYTSIYDLKDTVYKRSAGSYGSRACNFSEIDVKSIKDRSNTRKLSQLHPDKDMWCLFKERNTVIEHIRVVEDALPEYARTNCWYVTAEQVAIIQDLGIPHYTKVYQNAKKSMPANIYGGIVQGVRKLDDIAECVDLLNRSGVYGTTSVYSMLLANIDKLDKDHVFVRYVKCVAKMEAFRAWNHPVGRLYSLLHTYYAAVYRADKRKVYLRDVLRKEVDKLAQTSEELNTELKNAYPLLGYLKEDFLSSYVDNPRVTDAAIAVRDHVLRYMRGDC